MAYYDFFLIQNIKRFIRKHKILTFLIVLFFIFSFKKCFCTTVLEDSYPEMDFLTRVNYNESTGIYSKPGETMPSYCDSYAIFYDGGNFGVIFFASGLTISNKGSGDYANYFDFPRRSWDTASPYNVPANSYNYMYLMYNSQGTFRYFINWSRQAYFSSAWKYILFTTTDIYDVRGNLLMAAPDPSIAPSILTDDADLASLSFENLRIDPGTYDLNLIFRLYDTTENRRLIDIYFNDGEYDDYMEREDLSNPFSNLIYSIPIEALPPFNYINGHNYRWQLLYDTSDNQKQVNYDVIATLSQNVNETTNTDIQNSIDETNNKLDETNSQLSDINDSLTSSDISSVSSSDLPSVSISDPTENGIGTIFSNMYNAFCTGEPQDIVFPIPFTNKSITLHSNYIQQMLHNHNGDWVLTFIQAFWAFIFGRFIILDMASKIMKVKSGNIENLQETNIKMEMM